MRYFFPFFKSFAAFGSPLRILSAPTLAPLLGQPFLFDRNRLQEVNRKLAARVKKKSFFMWMFYQKQITELFRVSLCQSSKKIQLIDRLHRRKAAFRVLI